MRKTYYILHNRSMSVGQYLLNDEYCVLNPGIKVILEKKPTNYTENISVSIFRKDVPDEKQVQVNKQETVASSKKNNKKGE